jgi:hypothetical protein
MTWDKTNWAAYKAWEQAWLREHEHALPSRVRTKNGRWVALGKKHRRAFAHDAWLEMRRSTKPKGKLSTMSLTCAW